MMTSDNLMSMEQPWSFRPAAFTDAWISDMIFNNKENETLTKALQRSFVQIPPVNDVVVSPEMVESLFAQPDTTISPARTPTPTASGGSENEPPASKPRRNNNNLPPTGKVTKRKSRASKRATTTFITADPANFRQMVQQVTGVRFAGQLPVMKPEPQRINSRLQPNGLGLPTLDTSSAFLMDGGGAATSYAAAAPPQMIGGDGGGGGLEFDYSCSFPTLESWKMVM